VIRPFTADDLPAAAALLVERHTDHRAEQALLGPLDEAAATAAISALLEMEGTSGAVAVADGSVVGYLLGTPKAGASWGPNIWVEPAGCAGAHLPDLYAVAATAWVADGNVAHYALVPPSLAPQWFQLGFGVQHVHAARAVGEPVGRDHRVRRATRADIPVLARLDVTLDEHLVSSPVFSAAEVTSYHDAVTEWEGSFEDPAFAVFVAGTAGPDGPVVGSAVGCDVSQSSANRGLIVPPRAALLGFVAVLPEARGLGLGRALGQAVQAWAAEEGYPVICTDWRSANLTAARTWPSLGYAQTFLRLHRLVGH
jgi:GNAT superfamily N-acetyltransferase